MCFLRPCMWSRQKKGLMFRMATSDDRVKEDSKKKLVELTYQNVSAVIWLLCGEISSTFE